VVSTLTRWALTATPMCWPRTPLPDDGDTGRPTAESDGLVAIVDVQIDPVSAYLRAGIPDDVEPVVSFGETGNSDPGPHRQHGKIRSDGVARRSRATGRAPSGAVGGRDERRPGGVSWSARMYSPGTSFGENAHKHDERAAARDRERRSESSRHTASNYSRRRSTRSPLAPVGSSANQDHISVELGCPLTHIVEQVQHHIYMDRPFLICRRVSRQYREPTAI